VLAEFAPGLRVLVADADGNARAYALSELLPHSFDASQLP
jgi:cytidine deaminase